MMMNYHELTMSEPRDSPHRRRQFLVICTVMASAMTYSILTAGGLSSVEISVGEFPGGEFIFKHTKRDYAAANGMARSIGEDLDLKPKQLADVVYSVYLDHPGVIKGGREQRFAAGLLVRSGQDAKGKNTLLAKNKFLVPFTEAEFWDLNAEELFTKIKYEVKVLPKTRAAVAQFPFTDGFVSALIQSWKIIPAFHAYVEANGDKGITPIVISTCSNEEQMCTHYAPLSNGKPFLLGQKDSKTYAKTLEPLKLVDFEAAAHYFKKMFSPYYKFLQRFVAGEEL
jgi:hypothetical protein